MFRDSRVIAALILSTVRAALVQIRAMLATYSALACAAWGCSRNRFREHPAIGAGVCSSPIPPW